MTTDYLKIISATAGKIANLESQREAIDVEIAKQTNFFYATLKLLSEEQQKDVEEAVEYITRRDEGIKEAVRRVLMASDGWLTVAMVRDRLGETGFDFKKYTAAPFATISTTLKRLPEHEVERGDLNGVTAYRWIKKKAGMLARLKDLKRDEKK